ncbi:MAG: amidase [Dehalococcoidia bacterium]|nr:amidase [Dehalococcoidia bacterium]
MPELTDLTLTQASRLMRRRKLSPRELTQAHLTRIEKLNPRLNAYLTVTGDQAMRQAAASEERQTSGRLHGPLDGIPIGLKDLFATRGIRTTAGSKILGDWVPDHDAHVVSRLHAAGAVMLGKLNMHEFAFGVTNVNPIHGPARNPWDPERMTGGSSGGSGAAVAAGLAIAALGSDTGGSIRIPSGMCGIVGLKPTYGRVSRRGAFPLAWSLDHVGPMTKTVEDASLLLHAVAGHDPHDPASADVPTTNLSQGMHTGIKGMRFGLLPFGSSLEPAVAQALGSAQFTLQMLGGTIEEVTFPALEHAAAANTAILMAEAAALHRRWMDERPGDYGADVFNRLAVARLLPASLLVTAQRVRTLVRQQLNEVFTKVDVLLWPSLPIVAPPIAPLGPVPGQLHRDIRVPISRFTPLANLTGVPAISLPCGFSPEGLPIGLQMLAAPWQEATLLRAAYAFEQATEWHNRRPNAL